MSDLSSRIAIASSALEASITSNSAFFNDFEAVCNRNQKIVLDDKGLLAASPRLQNFMRGRPLS